ncbi:thioredoxin [Candidatus Uabimicrobium sp. HlEnr_7]|uniref:thioredoxin n=1 Tax=Candidatus Uabimicrobium helgolandensis TaxID=3095367 RepID=UPI0035591AB9
MKQIQNANEFEAEVLKNEKPVVVDFFTEWCSPCRALAPILEEISNEREDIVMAKVDAGNLADLAQKYGVMAFPTLMYFKGENVASTLTGLRSKDALLKWIDEQGS